MVGKINQRNWVVGRTGEYTVSTDELDSADLYMDVQCVPGLTERSVRHEGAEERGSDKDSR